MPRVARSPRSPRRRVSRSRSRSPRRSPRARSPRALSPVRAGYTRNPLTHRQIKIGGRTDKRLKKEGVVCVSPATGATVAVSPRAMAASLRRSRSRSPRKSPRKSPRSMLAKLPAMI